MSETVATPSRQDADTAPLTQWWLDGVTPTQIDSGTLARMIAHGLCGVSTNPAVLFDALRSCPARVLQPAQDELAPLLLPELSRICDLLAATYEGSNAHSGYVSADLPASIAHDAAAMVAMGQRMHAAVGRSNLLIKVPATCAGYQAIEELAYHGIGVYTTLAFTPGRVAAVRAAHRRGLARRLQSARSVQRIACIVSVPVTALDAAIDTQLGTVAAHLRGQAGAACALLAWRDLDTDTGYAIFAAFGAVPQLLALSGSAPALPGTIRLGGSDDINIPHVPQSHTSLQEGIAHATVTVAQLARHGIDLETIGNDALASGLTQLEQTQRNLLALMG